MFKETKEGQTNFCPQCENYAIKLKKIKSYLKQCKKSGNLCAISDIEKYLDDIYEY
jgi:hypothetical protein